MPFISEGDSAYLNTENLAELRKPQSISLNGLAALYLTKDHSQPTFPDEKPKIVVFHSGVFGIVRQNNSFTRIPIPTEADIITLIPRRDISKIHTTSRTLAQISTRRFVLIIYNPFKDQQKRKKVSRLIQRTPLIRIKPGLVLAPQIRATRFRPYQKNLLRPSEFVQKLVELGASVWYASRLELSHKHYEELIEQLLLRTINVRVQRIVTACRQLYTKLRNRTNENKSLTEFKRRLTRIRHRARHLRWQALFFKKEFGFDFQFKAARAYAAVSRVYQQLKFCDI